MLRQLRIYLFVCAPVVAELSLIRFSHYYGNVQILFVVVL